MPQYPTGYDEIKPSDLRDSPLYKLNDVLSFMYGKIGALYRQNNVRLNSDLTVGSVAIPGQSTPPADPSQALTRGSADKLYSTAIVDTHANRAHHPPDANLAPAFYFETDRNVLYISETSGLPPVATWHYAAGQMVGLMSARPTDLGMADEGFSFYATDTNAEYYWTGAAWATGSSVPPVLQLGPSGKLGIGSASAPAYTVDVRTGAASQVHISPTDVDDGTWLTSYSAGGHTASYLSSGAIFDGTNWLAKNSQAMILALDPTGNLIVFFNTGLIVGGFFAPTLFFQISLIAGQITVPTMMTLTPASGSKMLWADPGDGFRVKWMP